MEQWRLISRPWGTLRLLCCVWARRIVLRRGRVNRCQRTGRVRSARIGERILRVDTDRLGQDCVDFIPQFRGYQIVLSRIFQLGKDGGQGGEGALGIRQYGGQCRGLPGSVPVDFPSSPPSLASSPLALPGLAASHRRESISPLRGRLSVRTFQAGAGVGFGSGGWLSGGRCGVGRSRFWSVYLFSFALVL